MTAALRSFIVTPESFNILAVLSSVSRIPIIKCSEDTNLSFILAACSFAFLNASDTDDETYESAPETFGYESIRLSISFSRVAGLTPNFPNKKFVILSASLITPLRICAHSTAC